MTQKTKPCPICKKAQKDIYKPFCSKRCADVDLNRWFTGGYAVPGRDGEASVPANDFGNDADKDL